MKFASKFTDEEMKEICIHIWKYARECECEDLWQMSIADADMSAILNNNGFAVNVKFVERTRNKMGVKAHGGSTRKFNELQIREMEEIVCDFTQKHMKTWKLTVSDTEICAVLNDFGYRVNVKYVERMRRSLGIEPLGERGGARSQDPEYANLIALHDLDAYRLSYRSASSGALRGQSGADVQDRFGCHTTDLNEAIKRKSKELTRSNKQQLHICPIYSDPEDNNEIIDSIYSEEVNARSNDYGKKGKSGSIYNTRTAQVLTSIK